MSADAAAAGAPLPRLCCLEKGPNGYGFHLHGEKGKVGQFIRLVEPGSPAEKAGLLAGDRLVEVNGENVEKETHQQVVSRIRASLNAVRLLVVDPETDERLQKLGVQIREGLLRAQEGPGQAEPPAAVEAKGAGGENEPQAAAPEPRESEKIQTERVSGGPGRAGRRVWNGARGGEPGRETRAPGRPAPRPPGLWETRSSRGKLLPPACRALGRLQAGGCFPRPPPPLHAGLGLSFFCHLFFGLGNGEEGRAAQSPFASVVLLVAAAPVFWETSNPAHPGAGSSATGFPACPEVPASSVAPVGGDELG